MKIETIWAMYFSSVTGFQYHPANPPKSRLTIMECANIADLMLAEHKLRFPELEEKP